MKRATTIALGGAAMTAGAVAWLAARERRSDAPASYPPLAVPKPVADDVWTVDGGPIVASGLRLPIRMTVLRLPNGDLLLHSPTDWTPGLGRALDALGRVRHLVAPNVAHWTMIGGWQDAYPDALTWGAPGLRDRAAVKRAGLRVDRVLGDVAPADWIGTIDQGAIHGAAGFCELWFLHRPSRTLLLTDLVQNLDADRLPPISALVARIGGGATGTTPRYMRPVLDAAGRAALARLVALAPERVIFAHGQPFLTDAAERLRDALGWIGVDD